MTRSVVRPRTSPGRRFPSCGAALLALLFGAATLSARRIRDGQEEEGGGAPSPPTQATDEAAPEKTASPSAQVQDVEKPKRIVDTGQEAPKTDSLGHVHFASPNGEGLGRVAVKAAPEAKIKVFLEGRYFGTAPLTIYSVPKGDYIVEATYPTGKQVSKPVTVGENEETAVDLGGATDAVERRQHGQHVQRRDDADAAALDRGVPDRRGRRRAHRGDLRHPRAQGRERLQQGDRARPSRTRSRRPGKNYALLTNVGIVITAVGLVGAGITGYPLVFGSSEKKTALVVTPAIGPGLAGGVATLRF